jgi:hypothetical protein
MNYVLVINGDKRQREAIAAGFDNAGIPFRAAGSEQEAVLSLQEELPALIVWDWPAQDIPPEIFLAVLRQEGFCGSVLVCAPDLDVDDIPFDLLLQKPYRMNLLASTVSNLLIEEIGRDRAKRYCVPGA